MNRPVPSRWAAADRHLRSLKRVTKIPAAPRRKADGHKGTFGTVVLLAGSEGMLGAAILAARGALRGGVGLCRACVPESQMAAFTVAVPASTTLARTPMLRGFFDGATGALVGPGLGTKTVAGKQVRLVLRRATCPVVVDADGLNLLAPLRRPLRSGGALVLTPHPGEASRLLETDTVALQKDRITAVSELAAKSGQIAVLKGRGTLVCDGTRVYHNKTGNDGLATGGTGDVLAGLLGGLLAQGMDPFDAACLAVYVHGKAGDLLARRLSRPGLCAEDLPLAIAEVLR